MKNEEENFIAQSKLDITPYLNQGLYSVKVDDLRLSDHLDKKIDGGFTLEFKLELEKTDFALPLPPGSEVEVKKEIPQRDPPLPPKTSQDPQPKKVETMNQNQVGSIIPQLKLNSNLSTPISSTISEDKELTNLSREQLLKKVIELQRQLADKDKIDSLKSSDFGKPLKVASEKEKSEKYRLALGVLLDDALVNERLQLLEKVEGYLQ